MSGTDAAVGWATVNRTGVGWVGPNGIVSVSADADDRDGCGGSDLKRDDPCLFNPTANQTLTGSVTAATFKILPGATATSLNIARTTSIPALMLAGPNDFTITGSTGRVMNGPPRYIYVTTADTVLTLNTVAIADGQAAQSQPLTKSGAGTLALTGANNLLPFTATQNIYLVQGTLRGTVGALGGGTSSDGDFTTVNLRGGVLEIDGEGAGGPVNFVRANITSSANANGGVIRFGTSQFDRGEGGFSAFSAPGGANVTLVTAIGGSIRPLQRNSTETNPFLTDATRFSSARRRANSRVALTNDIQLDGGTAERTRPRGPGHPAPATSPIMRRQRSPLKRLISQDWYRRARTQARTPTTAIR